MMVADDPFRVNKSGRKKQQAALNAESAQTAQISAADAVAVEVVTARMMIDPSG
ncbi:MAG TPA: hypothetical protein VJ828_19035 [Lacipirellulaceae bacterium]|nr:hypothetical protein [Lacipirellulaceae bacterium]